MRRTALAVAAALAALAVSTSGDPAEAARPAFSLVTLEARPGASAAVRAAEGRQVSARLGIWRVPAGAAARLRASGAVGYSEPEQPRRRLGHLAAGDELVPTQWWLPRVGGDRVEPPGPGRPLTIIDSGLDVTHPDFAGRPDTLLLNEQTITASDDFHGTAVASVAAAAANGVGLVGLYPAARLLFDDATTDGLVTSGDVIRGLERAAARGPGIVNVSLGGPRSTLEALAVADVFARGTVIVAASGNEGERGRDSFPAALPHVVSVGATDRADLVADFSSRSGALDVAAPGDEIPVALPLGLSESGWGRASGTSFASPIVAAALAWVWTQRPELEKTQLLELLRRSARDLPPPGKDTGSGFGLLDVPRLLELAAPTVDPFEPNDDVDQVALSGVPRRPLTTRARTGTRVAARLDYADDPRDVYPVWAPARRRVVVTAQTGGEVGVRLLGVRPPGVRTRSRRSGRSRILTVTNVSRRGAWIFVDVYLPVGARPSYTGYTAGVKLAALPR